VHAAHLLVEHRKAVLQLDDVQEGGGASLQTLWQRHHHAPSSLRSGVQHTPPAKVHNVQRSASLTTNQQRPHTWNSG